jgi:Uma2 family endonuclease
MNRHHRSEKDWSLGVRRDLSARELPWPETTQAADGIPRRIWTRADIEAMVRHGIVDEDERFELIGGEVVPMSPKGARHEMVKVALNRHLVRHEPDDLNILSETTLWLDDRTYVEPDFCVWPRSIAPTEQRGYDVLLAVEIADTSHSYDLGRKIGIYAAYGVAEVWVINALSLVTRVHRGLGAGGYAEVFDVPHEEELRSSRRTDISTCLAALGLQPADA